MALRKDCVSFTRDGIREEAFRKAYAQNPIVSHLWTGIRETGCHINKHMHKNH